MNNIYILEGNNMQSSKDDKQANAKKEDRMVFLFFQGISQQQLQDHKNELLKLEEKQKAKDQESEKDPLTTIVKNSSRL